jgi:hypothetical protein
MIEPILAEFKREVALQRATDRDIEAMLERIATVNRPIMDADQLNYFWTFIGKQRSARS